MKQGIRLAVLHLSLVCARKLALSLTQSTHRSLNLNTFISRAQWPMTRTPVLLIGSVILVGANMSAIAQTSSREACLLGELITATPDTTVEAVRARCAAEADTPNPAPEQEAPPADPDASLIGARINREDAAKANRSTLVPHRRNYFMPITYMADPNEQPFQQAGDTENQNLDNAEIKFQLSIKVPLVDSLLTDNDSVYFGFTALSFWQAYNSALSQPFRETNYEPEFFYVTPVPWKLFNSDASLLVLGFSHQSNGREAPLSRGWNRLYANLIWEEGNFVFSLKPWWRIPESAKTDPLSAKGDDNPDIEKYMGYFEFTTAYRSGKQEYSALLRNNLRSDNYGALQLEWTFPMYKRVRGYVEYFNGYGESLIDYNAHMQRIGVGIMFSDLL
jgi:phospholipase A1